MQIPSRPIIRLLRHPNGAPSSAPMLRIAAHSRPLLSSMASSPPRRWLPTLAQRFASAAAALRLNPPLRHVSRFPHGSRNMASDRGVKGEGLGKQDRRRPIPSANNPIQTTKDIMVSMDKHFPVIPGMHREENRAAIEDFISQYGNVRHDNIDDVNKIATYRNEDVHMTTMDVTDGKQDPTVAVKEVADGEDARDQKDSEVTDDDGAYEGFTDCHETYPRDGSIHWIPLRRSRHRDGSITRGILGSGWKNEYRIADRNETRLEAMMLSEPNKDCIVEDGTCVWHSALPMLQIFSVKLAKTPVVDGPVELYGYIAARDLLDPLLNYIVNIGRDDPIVVEKGSLIKMTGPKRGIELSCTVLIEYDMRIKTGEEEKDDLQLIDGVCIVDELMRSSKPWTNRIHGDCGAIDITRVCIDYAFEATLEVTISDVQSSFDLCLSCCTSGLDEEIWLFDGVIGNSCGLRRHVVAVEKGKHLDLKLKVGLGSDCSAEHCHSFKATNHGCASEQIKIGFALVTLKVTWSSLEFFPR